MHNGIDGRAILYKKLMTEFSLHYMTICMAHKVGWLIQSYIY